MKRIYFDNAASMPLNKKVRRFLLRYGWTQGNPSSLHNEGKIARDMIERAREQCAEALGCLPEEIFFTSGATESNTWAQQIWHLNHNNKVHDSLKGQKHPRGITAISYINNETGVYDIRDYMDEPKLFVDLTSTIGHSADFKLSYWPNIVGASLSGHKIGALQGVGLLFVRKDQQKYMKPLIPGSQEKGQRGGTENTLGIISLGIAIQDCTQNTGMKQAKEYSLTHYICNLANELGLTATRSHHIVNITFHHLSAQTAVTIFNCYGIAISAGSACHSDVDKPSQTLLEEGYSADQALRTVRISLGPQNTMHECKKFVKCLKEIIDKYDVP